MESTYFGGRGATFDIPSFELNVLDTPGFGDSDPLKRKANAHRIALAFDFGVNSIILVIGKAELKLKDPVQSKFGFKSNNTFLTVQFRNVDSIA